MATAEQLQRMWALMRGAEGTFTISDARRSTSVTKHAARTLVDRLEREGFLTLVSNDPVRTFEFNKERDPGPLLPDPRRQRETERRRRNMWRTLSQHAPVTAKDLSVLSTAGGVVVSERVARDYLNALSQGGYVRRTKSKQPFYTLIRRTGPKPPVVRRVAEIFDPNAGEVTWRSEPEDAS